MKNKMKIEVNGKQYTFRFNAEKLHFECNYGYKDNFGNRQSRIIRGRSVEELTENLKTAIKKVEEHNVFNGNISFKNFFDFYINNIASVTNHPTTILIKKAGMKRIPSNIQNMKIKEITTQILQVMYANFQGKYSLNTIAYTHELLSLVFNQAMEYGIIKSNPNKKCSIKNFRNGKKKYIPLSEIKILLSYMKNNPWAKEYYYVTLFLAFSGCRIGEVLGLKKKSLDVTNCIATIKGQITRNKFSNTLKTSSSYRQIKLPNFVVDEIAKTIIGKEDNDFVFTTRKGKPINYQSYRERLKYCFSSCGLEYKSPKQFRNSFVKSSILNGIPLKILQNILGHSRISTTADIYGELEDKDTFFVADTLENAYANV